MEWMNAFNESWNFIFGIILIFIVIALFIYLFKRSGPKMSEEERILFLGSQEALAEAQKEAYKTIGDGNYTHLSMSPYQGKMTSEGIQLCNYITDKFINRIQTILNSINSLKHSLNSNLETNTYELSADHIYTNINGSIIHNQTNIRRLHETRKEADRDIVTFRGKYGISRTCSDKVVENPYFLLGFFIIVESLVNLWFYRTSFGAIESWLIAFFVSFFNILVGYWAGTKFTQKNLPESSAKKWGWSFFGFNFILVAIFMSFVAWFRLHQDGIIIDNSLVFDTFILLMIGLVANAFSFHKGYNFDDPFPEYGKLCRNKKHADDEYYSEVNEAREKIINSFDYYDKQFKEKQDSVKFNLNTFQKRLAEASNEVSAWNNEYSSLVKKINSLNDSFNGIVKSMIRANENPALLDYKPSLPNNDAHKQKVELINVLNEEYSIFLKESEEFLKVITTSQSKYHELKINKQEKMLEDLEKL